MNNWSEIIIALSAFLGTLIGALASARLTQYRLKKLEEKVDAHNKVIERTYRLEEQTALLDERIKVANHRIDDLEKGA